MQRDELVNAVLRPFDRALAAGVDTLERFGALNVTAEKAYDLSRVAFRALFDRYNHLEIEGEENIPAEGGVILASNHQSWFDIPLLACACPRRIHFVAKEEFRSWPLLRSFIRMSESVFVRRGGDDNALAELVRALEQGWALAIYPEGTIPGEEDIPRSAVEPHTGLLRGHSGVARLALQSGAPIIPVGISGASRAFPPEIYPRLELLRLPKPTPIKIRFGKPISPTKYAGREHDRALFREVTDHVMHEISSLVDHAAGYVPIELPIPELPRYERLGVLLLHGFTSHLNTVNGLVPYLEQAGIPYEMPILRGHGTRWQDMRGTTHHDWYEDAERALLRLASKVDRVCVVGLSMGGLVSLELAMRHPDKIAGLVTVAAALAFKDPLSEATPLLAKVVPSWPSPESFNDLSLKVNCKNYPRFATDAFASLLDYAKLISDRLAEVRAPIRVLQSKKDQIVAPSAANRIYEGVSSAHREIVWYQESGHEMMQDLEAEKVFTDIMDFVGRLRAPAPKS